MQSELSRLDGRRAARLLPALAVLSGLALLGAVVVHKAWVTDDAYITFRSVQNFVEGRGPNWNPDERVQVFTHPLWMMWMSVLHAVSGEFFYSAIASGVALTLATAALLAFRLASSWQAACAGLAVLAVSRAFTDYSTSGLENSLLHFLLVLLLVLDDGRPAHARPELFSTVAGACLLTRLDALLLVLPAWLVVLRRSGPRTAIRALVIGLTPFVAWEIGSVLYYGSFLPNSARAKLDTGLPAAELIEQGLHYLWNSLYWDPVTLAAVACGCAAGYAALRAGADPRAGAAPSAPWAWATGAIANLLYVVWVGGDFMSGRFLTAALVVGLGVVVSRPVAPHRALASAAAVLVLLLVPWTTPFRERHYGSEWHSAIDAHGIADERSFYLATGSLRASWGIRRWPSPNSLGEAAWLHHNWPSDFFSPVLWATGVVSEADWPPPTPYDENGRPYRRVIVRGAVGFLGFYLGPGAHVLDYHAIGDPLLARLPMTVPDPVLSHMIPRLAGKRWRVGHYFRRPPEGYLRTLATGRNVIRDPQLARYYDVIRSITRDPVFDRERLATLWRFQLGAYDDLLREARQGP